MNLSLNQGSKYIHDPHKLFLSSLSSLESSPAPALSPPRLWICFPSGCILGSEHVVGFLPLSLWGTFRSVLETFLMFTFKIEDGVVLQNLWVEVRDARGSPTQQSFWPECWQCLVWISLPDWIFSNIKFYMTESPILLFLVWFVQVGLC